MVVDTANVDSHFSTLTKLLVFVLALFFFQLVTLQAPSWIVPLALCRKTTLTGAVYSVPVRLLTFCCCNLREGLTFYSMYKYILHRSNGINSATVYGII